MSDENTTIQELKEKVAQFVHERNWKHFHSPKNLSMTIAIEAAELMEKFQWINEDESYKEIVHNKKEIEEELADVFSAILSFAYFYKIDLSDAFVRKMMANAQKYPIKEVKNKGIEAVKRCREKHAKHKD